MCSLEETRNDNLWYLFCRNLVSLRRISCRHRPPNGSRCPGLPTWIQRSRRECYVPLDSWSSTYGTLKESAYVHILEPQHQGYHEEPHKPMDRGDCQGSLHSSWSTVRPCDGTWGQSAFNFMGVQLSGGPTWHPVSGILEVFWGLPEFVSTRHGLYCWGHVDTGSSCRNCWITIVVCRLIGDRCRVLHEQIDEELLKFIEVFIIHYDMTSQQGSQPKLCPGYNSTVPPICVKYWFHIANPECMNKSQVHPKLHKVIEKWGVETCS